MGWRKSNLEGSRGGSPADRNEFSDQGCRETALHGAVGGKVSCWPGSAVGGLHDSATGAEGGSDTPVKVASKAAHDPKRTWGRLGDDGVMAFTGFGSIP